MQVDISIDCEDWNGIPDLEALARTAVDACLPLVEDRLPGRAELSLAFVGDAGIQKLNREFRNMDKATNVLSFPLWTQGACAAGAVMLGDIVLSYQTVLRESREQDKLFEDHLRHLIVHGFLHLFGYDHETDGQAEDMEALETEILSGIGVADPYDGSLQRGTREQTGHTAK